MSITTVGGRMRGLVDFGSWPGVLTTLAGIALITLVAVGIRLLVVQTVQQRRERENRQVNERLRTLIAAYKTLGGSFTGDLLVDPAHLRELREAAAGEGGGFEDSPGGERRRRIRDAVEAALSDVILLGTEEQVRLAARAAAELAAGRPVETAELVVSLRNFIREVLDLDPVPADVAIPRQGALRPGAGGGAAAARIELRAEAPAGAAAVRPRVAPGWASVSAPGCRARAREPSTRGADGARVPAVAGVPHTRSAGTLAALAMTVMEAYENPSQLAVSANSHSASDRGEWIVTPPKVWP